MVSPYQFTLYPTQLDNNSSLPAFVDLKTPVRAEEGNRLRESILAIQGELGTDPSGIYTTVRARLDALEAGGGGGAVSVSEDGTTVISLATDLNFTGNVTVTDAGGGQATILIGGADGYQPVHQALTVSSNGQVNFTLSQEPWNDVLLLWIGGVKQEIGDYTVSGTSLTWDGALSLLTSDVVEVLYWKLVVGSGGGGGGGSSVAMAQQTFTAGAAQMDFVVAGTPINQQSTELFIDGISMTVGTDYTLSGSTVTYSGAPALTGGEDVVVKYLYTP